MKALSRGGLGLALAAMGSEASRPLEAFGANLTDVTVNLKVLSTNVVEGAGAG
jgi:hypothetical protein